MKKLVSPALVIAMAVLAVAGCSAPAAAPVSTEIPVIKSFTADPASIVKGDSTQISWLVTNAKSVVIDNGIGNVALSGSFAVKPTGDVTYKMTAANAAGSANAVVSVKSRSPGSATPAAPTPVLGKPVVSDFSARPANIPSGNKTTLSWSVINADSISIDRGVGKVKAAGMVNVKPEDDTVYTLTAVNKAGATTATLEVIVDTPSTEASVKMFMANPGTIDPGDWTVLSWEVVNADYVRITGIGNVAPKGSIRICPTSTIVYTLTATNPASTITSTCEITVNEE